MAKPSKTVRALGLCSGGLDSILSGLVLRDQGIAVEWITFESPFFTAAKAIRASRQTGIRLRVQRITGVYMEMLRQPPAGFGQQMNPCMDCHALMFRLAGQVMHQRGFDFVFSGEVLAQRPMSQTRSSLRYVAKHSGIDGYIVRPLSALRLPESIPEQQGLVQRERLLGLAGRSRKPQIELARHYGITEFPTPAGGCLLTDVGFSRRLRDLFKYQPVHSEGDLMLLQHGRHFRLDNATKIVVGRTKVENEALLKLYRPDSDWLLKARDLPGPIVIVPQAPSKAALQKAAAICARYCKSPGKDQIDISVTAADQRFQVRVAPLDPETVSGYLI